VDDAIEVRHHPTAVAVSGLGSDPLPLATSRCLCGVVLQRLAEGMVYKQIAQELALSVSTVRSHLHNVYGKLGAVDRAQAVLIANERDWL
jgi:DNA-binding NarL/FixJ family response regulator